MRSIKEVCAEIREISGVDSLVAFLVGKGIKGHRSRATTCPLANYIAQETGIRGEVSDADRMEDGGSGCAVIYVRDPFEVGNGETYELCYTANNFIELFDRGEIPELDADKEAA